VHSILGETPMDTNIAGHEGIGRVVELGAGVPEEYMDTRVGVKWLYSACKKCAICEVGTVACPNQKNPGRNVRGTFQQYMVSPAEFVTRIPAQLKSEHAAPLLCAGLTIYSAIAKTRARPGDWIVLPGAGGGLGHIGVQIAAKKGYKVIAIDSSELKRDLCMKLGAAAFIDFRTDDVEKEVMKLTSGVGAHALICTAGSEAAYTQAPRLIRNFGVLVCVGLPRLNFHLPISPFEMVVRSLTVVGSAVGNVVEMNELLEMAVAGDVIPHVEVFEFGDIQDVLSRLAKSEIEGRAVIRIPQ